MQIEVQANPNCGPSEQFVFTPLSEPRPIRAILANVRGSDAECDAVGVEEDGRWVQAHAVKVTDSGAGYAFLIYGGAWGLRFRPAAQRTEAWDLANPSQWGEPFKLYGDEKDIFFE